MFGLQIYYLMDKIQQKIAQNLKYKPAQTPHYLEKIFQGPSYKSHIVNVVTNEKKSLPKISATSKRIEDQKVGQKRLMPYIRIQTFSQQKTLCYSPKNVKKTKEELRQTEDSVRPFKSVNSLKIEDFNRIKILGKGKHGIVLLVIHKKTGFIGALKILVKEKFKSQTKAKGIDQELMRQLKIHSFASHSHITKLYSIFSDAKYIYIFMELASQGQLFDLFEKKKNFKEETISFICKSLLEALKYLHSYNIIHRDIKPENIVLANGFPKICDFGQSNFCSKEKGQLRDTLCGTPLYLSPEMLLGQKYDEKIDIWALGALSYELFCGENPFNIKNKDQINKIITEEFKMTKGSLEFCNFIIYCLKKDPEQRPSAAKLLKHPFIKKWEQLQTAQELCNK